MSKAAGTAVAKKENTALSTSVLDFSADAGMGMEGADKDSFALPFITILQGLSPQMETVEGAKIGKFINTITNEIMDSVDVIPCAFQRRYLEWAKRSDGGGFFGSHEVAEVESGPMLRDAEGMLVNAEGHLLKDTRTHFVLVLREDGTFYPALISMSSTQIKKSKRWLSRIQGVQLKDANGRIFTPPSFSHVYRLNSVKESNDSGTWYGFEINMVGPVEEAEVYQAAKALNHQVAAGVVQASAPVDDSQQAGGDEKF